MPRVDSFFSTPKSLAFQDGKEYRKKLRHRSDEILKDIEKVLSSIYSADVSSTNYGQFLRQLANELAKIDLESDNLLNDTYLKTLRSEYLYQKFGYQITNNQLFFPINYFSDVKYKDFLLAAAETLTKGATKENIKKSVEIFTGQSVIVESLVDSIGKPGSIVDISDQFTLKISVVLEDLKPYSTLENYIDMANFLLNIIKPAHIIINLVVTLSDQAGKKVTSNWFKPLEEDPLDSSDKYTLLIDDKTTVIRVGHYDDFRQYTHEVSDSLAIIFNDKNHLLNAPSIHFGENGYYLNAPADLTSKRYSLYKLKAFFVPNSSVLNAGYTLEFNNGFDQVFNKFDRLGLNTKVSNSGRFSGDPNGFFNFTSDWGVVLGYPSVPIDFKYIDTHSGPLYKIKSESLLNLNKLNENFKLGFHDISYNVDLENRLYTDAEIEVEHDSNTEIGSPFRDYLKIEFNIDDKSEEYKIDPVDYYLLFNNVNYLISKDYLFGSSLSGLTFDIGLKNNEELVDIKDDYLIGGEKFDSKIDYLISPHDEFPGFIMDGILFNVAQTKEIETEETEYDPNFKIILNDINYLTNDQKYIYIIEKSLIIDEEKSSILDRDLITPGTLFLEDIYLTMDDVTVKL